MPFLRPEPPKAAGLFYAPGFLSAGHGWRIHRPSAFGVNVVPKGLGFLPRLAGPGI